MIGHRRMASRVAVPWTLVLTIFGCTRTEPQTAPTVDATDVHFTRAKSWARDGVGSIAWIDDDARGAFVFPAIDPSRIRLTTGGDAAIDHEVQPGPNGLVVTPSARSWLDVHEELVAWVDARDVKRQRVRKVVREGDTPLADFWRRWDEAHALYRVPDLAGARQAWLGLEHHQARDDVEGQIAKALENAAYTLYRDDQFDEAAALLRRAEALVRPLHASQRAEVHYHESLLAHYSGAYLAGLRHMETAVDLARATHNEKIMSLGLPRVGVSLLELGRVGEALAFTEGPDLQLSTSMQNGNRANRAWIRTAAMEAGLIPVDYESVRAEHARAAEAMFEEKRYGQAVNQRANEAALLLKMDQLPEALERLREIEAHEAEIQAFSRTSIETLRARVEIRQGALAAARARLDRMADPNRPRTSGRCRAIELLGDIDRAEGRLEPALARYRESAACLDEMDRLLVTVSASAQWANAHGGPEARMARALVLLGRADEAFRLLDAARASVLEQKVDALAVDGSAEPWFAYQTARRAEERGREVGCAAAPTKEAHERCTKELAALSEATKVSFAKFQASVPPREATTRDAAWPKALRRALGSNRALLLVSGHGDDVLHLLVDKNGVASSTASNPIAHWDARIAEVEHLFVVPDGHPRSFDPFAVAPKRSMSLLPHADVLLRAPHTPTGPAIVIADPDGTLPRSADEGAWVVERLDARPISNANRKAWLEAVRTASVLHYAGHAEGTRGDPWSVRLRLADGETLDVFDLLAEPALPRLVVLNGCATGPKARAGGGGLPAALVHRGASHVLTTSDGIEDGATTAFLEDFYEANGAERPAHAFRVAVAKSIERDDGAWETMRLWGR